MPIYKLSTSHHSAASVRHSQPPPSDAVSVGEKANGDVVHNENRGHYQDNLYAQRPSPAKREVDFEPKKSSFNRKESMIEREIREQLRRESELAALRGLPTLVRVSSDQVDQNEDHHHHHHRTPDPSWNYYEVQVLPPEHRRNSTGGERKLTVIRSPGGATSSTTTITTTTSSVNGSKPGKVDYRRGVHDMVEQKGRKKEEKEEEEDRRGQWKEPGVDLEVENLENGRWTEWKRTEKNDDVVDSGVIARNAEKTEKETPGEQGGNSFRDSWSPVRDVQRNLHRVQPFDEADFLQSELFAQYVPQSETPIHREIRRASEREDDLRVARGLVSLVSRESDGGAEAEIEVVVLRPPQRMVEGGGGGGGGEHSIEENHAMKRFAESRLRAELEREKRREIDLLREGKIQLLSEQRVPEFVGLSSRNRVSSETEELREFSARRRSLEDRDSGWDVTASGAGRRNADAAAVENRTAFSANPRMSYGGGSKGVTVTWSDARNANGSGEGVIMRNHSATAAEQRIENEIVELRKRESELRQERRSRNSDIPVDARSAQTEVVEEHGAHAQAAKPEVFAPTSPEPRFDRDYDSVDHGRPAHLALIDQWERGIIQRGGITT